MADIVAAEHGDIAAILERLRETEGIDETAIDGLESWLIAEHFMATSEPLERDEIRTRVMASATSDIERERLTMNDVEEVLTQLPR